MGPAKFYFTGTFLQALYKISFIIQVKGTNLHIKVSLSMESHQLNIENL